MPRPLSPLAMLATSMQAQPGVYALLLGSGVSTGAGMPTGWGVVSDLVAKVAAVEDDNSVEDARRNPEAWWAEHHDGDLGYSELLESLAPTQAARQGLLRGYFEQSDDDREHGLKAPSQAHMAIAELVRRGSVRVIVTTNFDRLMERALEAVGVQAQVIARPEAIAGMEPLAHAAATIIKVNGDFLDLATKNTVDELQEYPEAQNELLRQVFDEFGLVVSGWSAEWDTALVTAMEQAASRRYPLYWDARSSKREQARRLLDLRSGHVVEAAGADEMFTELHESLEALDRLAEPPLSTAMAVARLKRYLPDPVRRIDLHDLVMGAADDVVDGARNQPLAVAKLSVDGYQKVLDDHREQTRRLCELVATGVRHDPEGTHDRLWMDMLERLISAGSASVPSGSSYYGMLDTARLYPALLVLTAAGLAATDRRRDDLLIKLATEVSAVIGGGMRDRLVACQVAHPYRVLDPDAVKMLPRWAGTAYSYPVGRLLKADMRDLLGGHFDSEDDYVETFHGLEYRMALISYHLHTQQKALYGPASGEFVGERQWTWEEPRRPLAEVAFRETADLAPEGPWDRLLGGADEYEKHIEGLRELLTTYGQRF